MASSGDPGVFGEACIGEAGVGPEIHRVHDWVPKGMELRFAFLMHIRKDRYMFDAKDKKKYQGGFDYLLPMASNWSFRQFREVIKVDHDAHGVDAPEDIQKIEALMWARNIQ